MNALRSSFNKSHGTSSWNSLEDDREDQRPILFGNHHDDSRDHQEVIVKIEDGSREIHMQTGNGNKVSREPSYEFWKEGNVDNGGRGRRGGTELGSGFSFPGQNNFPEIAEDPPSRLISSFLQKQKTSGSEMTLDMDLEMDDLKKPETVVGQSKELRVSFQDISNDPLSGNFSGESGDEDSDDGDGHSSATMPSAKDAHVEVLQGATNSSLPPKSSMLGRVKTRSRLMDPPPANFHRMEDRKSMKMPNRSSQLPPRSGQFQARSSMVRSGLLGKSSVIDEDEEDPFEDLPDEFKRTKISSWMIVQLIALFIIVTALVCSLTIHRIQHKTVWSLRLWKWIVLVLVLISGRLLSGWFIRIIVLILERNFNLRKRLLYFVYGVRKAVQNCIWLGLVLLTWQLLFDKKAERQNVALSYITRIIFCLIVATALRLVKTLLIKFLASSFHVSTYFDRIQEAIFNQYIIETLSGPPIIEIQHNMEEDDQMLAEVQKFQNAGAKIPNDLRAVALPIRSGRVMDGSGGIPIGSAGLRKSSQIGKSIKLSGGFSRKDFGRQLTHQEDAITMDQLHKFNQKNISAWNMKRLMRIIRHGTLTTLDEQIPLGNGEDESTLQIRSEHEAKIAARKIFNNVTKDGAKHIYLVDLMRFMREDEAVRTMSLFKGETHGVSRVGRRSLNNWVVNAFRERRALALTLNDTKTAVNKLHQMANVVVAIIVILLWLIILNIMAPHFIVLLSSQLLLLVFIFGNTVKMIFEAIIFLFVIHPFDVGDRCEVEGVQMIVDEMNILTTVFLRYDNLKITYQNSVLAQLHICNHYRSPDMGDSIDFCIHVSTPVEKIAIMREKITSFIEARKDHWYPGSQLVVKDVEDMNRLNVSVWMRHRINFQNMGLKWTRREPVLQETIRILRELDVEYRMLPVDVNIRNLPPVTTSRLPSTWATCS
ncbi:Mechanosensitive ion channel protein 6 [Platanthera guangdongensis]|uniref:Mechanosensitive ion channel protein n=1 Tax=Platanthera guangdongensis TaxID=2320717 RepID=A0ABR2LN06_9ASPA